MLPPHPRRRHSPHPWVLCSPLPHCRLSTPHPPALTHRHPRWLGGVASPQTPPPLAQAAPIPPPPSPPLAPPIGVAPPLPQATPLSLFTHVSPLSRPRTVTSRRSSPPIGSHPTPRLPIGHHVATLAGYPRDVKETPPLSSDWPRGATRGAVIGCGGGEPRLEAIT